jgi:hypothetical protein
MKGLTKIFFSCICIVLISCEPKYDFGPKFSIRTAKSRVCNKWKIYKIYHSSALFNSFAPESEIPMTSIDYLTRLEIKKNNTVNIENLNYNPHNPILQQYYTGNATWGFYEGFFGPAEERLSKNEGFLLKLPNDFQICYKILKLKENELLLYGRWYYEISGTTSGEYCLKLITTK